MTTTKTTLRDWDAENRVVSYWSHASRTPVVVAIDCDEQDLDDTTRGCLALTGFPMRVRPEGRDFEATVWYWECDGEIEPRDAAGNTIASVFGYSDPSAYAALAEAK